MFNRALTTSLIFVAVLLSACGGSPDWPEEELLDVAEQAVECENSLTPNSLIPNSLIPNSLVPNSLVPNSLVPNALASDALSAITDPGAAGAVSRDFMRYLVSCALGPTQSFAFSWTDAQSNVHNETYWGQLGIAPTWTQSALSVADQEMVSACMAARTNYYGSSVIVSLRVDGSTASLEKTLYPAEEGAFWGNLFAATPWLKACYNEANISNSRAKLRDCAAGHLEGETVTECGIIDIIGSCNAWCDPLDSSGKYRTKCVIDPGVSTTTTTTEIASAFLLP